LRVRDNSKKKGKLKLLQKPNGRRSKLKKKKKEKKGLQAVAVKCFSQVFSSIESNGTQGQLKYHELREM